MTASGFPRLFVQSPSGLYLPDVQVPKSDSDGESGQDSYRRREVSAVVVAAICAVVGVVLVVPTMVLNFRTFAAQERLNAAQDRLAAEERERQQRRYAERVTWFDQIYPTDQTRIYNRSPVLLNVVTAYMDLRGADGRKAYMMIGAIPPCTAAVVEIPRFASGAQSSRVLDGLGWRTDELEFEDAVGLWRNDVSGLRLIRHGAWMRGTDASRLGQNTTNIMLPDDQGPSLSAAVRMEPLNDCGVDT